MLSKQLIRCFHREHQKIREALLRIVEALRKDESLKLRVVTHQASRLLGPHLQYLEEVMFPEIEPLVGTAYLERLRDQHGKMAETFEKLEALSKAHETPESEREAAARDVHDLLPLICECEGLVIGLESLSDHGIKRITAARENALSEGRDILAWCEEKKRWKEEHPKSAAAQKKEARTRARDVMTEKIQVCTLDDSALDALKVMEAFDCGFVPIVLDQVSRVLEGVVTDRDLAIALGKHDDRPGALALKKCLRRHPITVGPESPIAEVTWLMEKHEIQRIPVVDENRRIVGLISMRDLAREAWRERSMQHREITERGLGEIMESMALRH